MASGITSISAEFSVGSSTSKTMISMATSRRGISMVTTSSISHIPGNKRTPAYSVTSLRPVDPLSSQTVLFIKDALKEYTTESCKLYWYCLTHPATLAYMVLLGGLLFQYGLSKALALAVPPVLTFYFVKARLRAFSMKDELELRSDLANPDRYFNQRKRALFVAAREENDDAVTSATTTTACDTTTTTTSSNTRLDNQVDRFTVKPQSSSSTTTTASSLVLGTVAVDTECAGSTAVLRYLCVDSKYRRLGIGQELLEKAIAFCEKERFLRIILSTNNLQGPAAKMCRKHGFHPIHETVDLSVLPGVDITRTHFVRCLRARHTSSCCR